MRQLLHNNYLVTELSFKLKDIYKNALNCAENTKNISEQGYQKLGNVWHFKANISLILPF